jgi:hypothetical protein
VEDDGYYPVFKPDRETRRPIAVPCIYAEDMHDETVWIATGRGELLRGKVFLQPVSSKCMVKNSWKHLRLVWWMMRVSIPASAWYPHHISSDYDKQFPETVDPGLLIIRRTN